jgi:hypothetical protein
MSPFEPCKSTLTVRTRELAWKGNQNTCQRRGLLSYKDPEDLGFVGQACHVEDHAGAWGTTGKAKERGGFPSCE